MTKDAPAIHHDHAPPGRAARAQVFYDGQCPLCLKSVALLQKLDWLHQLAYVNARQGRPLPAGSPPLEADRLLQEMHLLVPGGRRVYHGFGAFRWMAWRLPLLWPLAPLLYLPGVPALGQRLYLWVARHRFQLVPCHGGVCTLNQRPGPSSPARTLAPAPPAAERRSV